MAETNTTPPQDKEKWSPKGLIDFAYNVLSFLKYGGSANVTVEPYASGISVAPVQQSPAIPWVTLALIGGGALVLVALLKD
jgi:hypothetical protein